MLNWMSNSYPQGEGYGRFSAHMIQALLDKGVEVMPCLRDHFTMPDWMLARTGVSWDRLTIACMPPFYLPDYVMPGRTWLFTMTEGGLLPDDWADFVHNAGIERVIVPCEHNRKVFAEMLNIPVHVVPGGTDPVHFPVAERNGNERYTFLALADRGSRKGWTDVWEAFHQEFGSADETPDVGLIVKCRPDVDHVLNRIELFVDDPRIRVWIEEAPHPAQVWAEADCVAIPSRCEGWGMPHREAAMMGKPVLATRHGGLDDGYTDQWAIPLDDFKLEQIGGGPESYVAGEWAVVSMAELRSTMRWCYENQEDARAIGLAAAKWLRGNQTWEQASAMLLDLIEEYA